MALPITVSPDAGGIWDVSLSTAAGDSTWEGATTTLIHGTIRVRAPVSLAVNSRLMPPGATAPLVVSGNVDGLDTFGNTILAEIVPRPGNTGTLIFTPSPPIDITQERDPWPGLGSFTPFDTDATGADTLNGSVDDNGSFLPGPLTFDGDLVSFPLVASVDASGTWDVRLSTSAGSSSWEGLATVLIDGTVTVTPGACAVDADCDDGNICTVDSCDAGTCVSVPAPAACDDGDPCTLNDACVNGACVGFPRDCSSLDDACHTGVCNPTTGVCEAVVANEGGPCDDGDLCTTGDICNAGLCVGTPVDCSPLNDACNVGVCNATTGQCEAQPINEGGPCDDGDLCTTGDICTTGACAGTPVDCSGVGGQCGPASCNPATGQCEITPVRDGTFCDDGDPCTVLDFCLGGICTGTAVDCSALDDVCVMGVCDPATGQCTTTPTNEGGICDDGNACTTSDVCTSGVCVGTAIPGCQVCQVDADCDDGNVCTQNVCVNGTCSTTNLTGSCDDGDRCTVNDVCAAGVCAGTPVDCTALSDACNIGTCNPATGTCFAQPTNEGRVCDDGLPCTSGDVCSNGVCSGSLVGNPAVDLALVPTAGTVQVGQTVSIQLVATSAVCADSDITLIDAVVQWDPTVLALTGQSPAPIGWTSFGFPDDSALDGFNAPFGGLPDNDGDAYYQLVAAFGSSVRIATTGTTTATLTFTALAGTTGTTVSLIPNTAGFTKTRVLGAGANLGMDITGALASASLTISECQTNADCDDGNVCTDEFCSAGICVFTNNTLPCDDGLFCTSGDTCSGGVCVGGGDPCVATGQLCSEALGACVECLTGADCDDGNPCTDDLCGVDGVCNHANNTSPCDDGLFCTATDVCGGGTCNGSGSPCAAGLVCDELNDQCVECLVDADCDDANVCTDDTCVLNVCQHTPNTLPCDDGLFCTTGDTCSNGVCTGGPSPCADPTLPLCNELTNSCVECFVNADCDDGNPCTDDFCTIGICQSFPNTSPCDDGLFCTANDVCTNGVCVGSGDPCPGLLCDETNDQCVECFTVSDCPDDGIACTVDACVNGVCRHDPSDALCDDGLFCNGPETCNALLGCVAGSNPCDDPNLCVEANDSCGCQAPAAVGEGSRYLAVTPGAGQTPVALVVTGVNPEVSCISLYVQPDGSLGPNPVFKVPRGVDGWNTVHVFGAQIAPSMSYAVQTECETGVGIDRSVPVVATTWLWGDADNSGGIVDVGDMTLVVDGFRGDFQLATLYAVDLWGRQGDGCTPDQQIDVLDMTRVVDAFRQFPYPCPIPCP
ncbi:MAG: hypothetical protein D6788_10395 [Planctomycetota bacterium]|nr:MAG: hypothetical protein D6788_10395 [Planctomycetota bacterium]